LPQFLGLLRRVMPGVRLLRIAEEKMKIMSRRNSIFGYFILIALAVFGAWLNGQFTNSVENYSFLRLFLGLLIMVGALIGIVLLIRHNMRPMSQAEKAGWEIIRKGGKRSFIRSSLVRGFFLGLISISWPLFSDLWHGNSIANDLWIFVALILVVTFGSYYAAMRIWDANEYDYKSSVQSEAQPNNSFNPTPR
jgi:hypothetical protein